MDHTPAVPFSQENDRGALVWLPVGRIYDNPYQPRANYDDVDSLAESIWALRQELPATLGLQQPPVARIVVFGDDGDARPVERTSYGDQAAVRRLALSDKHAVELHFGHRRLRAWKLLRDRDPGYAEFPVLLAYADDLGMQSLAAKATKLTYEHPLGITPAVLLRLAQECPEVTLSGHFGRMAREWRAVAA